MYLGAGDGRYLSSSDMYFASIDRCNYFAGQLAKRYGNYQHSDYLAPADRVTTYCIPKLIKKGSIEVYE